MSANLDIQDSFLVHQVMLQATADAAVRDVVKVYGTVARELRDEALRLLPTDYRAPRNQALLNQAEGVLRQAASMADQDLNRRLVSVARAADLGFAQAFDDHLQAANLPRIDRLNDAALLRALQPGRRIPFARLVPEQLLAVRQATAESALQGEPVPKAARRLQVAVDSLSRNRAETITRTEMAQVSVDVQLAVAEQNKAVVAGVKFTATLDHRTCLRCGPLDGRRWPDRASIPSTAIPPVHPRCRCVLVPFARSLDEILGLPPSGGAGGTRASLDGQVPASLTWADWVARIDAKARVKLPDGGSVAGHEYAQALLGPQRYALWKAGAITLKDLTADGAAVPVVDLRAGRKPLPVAPAGFPVQVGSPVKPVPPSAFPVAPAKPPQVLPGVKPVGWAVPPPIPPNQIIRPIPGTVSGGNGLPGVGQAVKALQLSRAAAKARQTMKLPGVTAQAKLAPILKALQALPTAPTGPVASGPLKGVGTMPKALKVAVQAVQAAITQAGPVQPVPGVSPHLQALQRLKAALQGKTTKAAGVTGLAQALKAAQAAAALRAAQAAKPAFKPEAATYESPVDVGGDEWEEAGPQRGSNPGGMFRHKATGRLFYVKAPRNPEQARDEILAAQLYRAAGVKTPMVVPAKFRGGPGIASEIVDGLESDRTFITAQDKKKRSKDIVAGFIADAWLANWDVVGMGYDNLLRKRGTKDVYRVDTGGALRFRAQGGLKYGAWGDTVLELDSLRKAGVNPQAASVFGGITDEEAAKAATKVTGLTQKAIKALVDQYGPTSAVDKAAMLKTLLARQKYLKGWVKEVKARTASPPAAPTTIRPGGELAIDPDRFRGPKGQVKIDGRGFPVRNRTAVTEMFAASQIEADTAIGGETLAAQYKAWKAANQPANDGIRAFSGSAYVEMRDYQRGSRPEASVASKKRVQDVEAALRTAPRHVGNVFRGISVPDEVVQSWLRDGFHVFEGLTSMSRSPRVSAGFAGMAVGNGKAANKYANARPSGYGNRKSVIFSVKNSQSGVYIGGLSAFGHSEGEVMFGRGAVFRIVETTVMPWGYWIEMEEIVRPADAPETKWEALRRALLAVMERMQHVYSA